MKLLIYKQDTIFKNSLTYALMKDNQSRIKLNSATLWSTLDIFVK